MAKAFIVACMLGFAWAAGWAAPEHATTEHLRVRTLTLPYDSGAVFVMPHEKVPIAVAASKARLFRVEAKQGALVATAPNRWTWEAPGTAGRYALDVKDPDGKKVFDFNAFVMVPA